MTSTVPIGEAANRLRRRSRIIDAALLAFVVGTPIALALNAWATVGVSHRADTVVRRQGNLEQAEADLRAAVVDLETATGRLEEGLASFAALATATTPEERAAARADLERLIDEANAARARAEAARRAATTTTTTRPRTTTTTSRANAREESAPSSPTTTTTTTAPPPSSTTTTAPPAATVCAGAVCITVPGPGAA